MLYTLKVIGIHRGGDESLKINYGSFIGEILNEIEIELIQPIKHNNHFLSSVPANLNSKTTILNKI